MQYHELANIFPLMEGQPFQDLVQDIADHGQREPIWIYQSKILDGRNRYRACVELGLAPITKEYSGDDPARFVISLNLHRRHLNESQRAMVAARLANITLGGDRRSATFQTANLQFETTRQEAGEMLNVSERLVNSAKRVETQGAPELSAAVESGRVSVSSASEVSTLPQHEQAEIVAKGEREIIEKAKEIRRARSEAKKQQRKDDIRKQVERIEAGDLPALEGIFDVVVMDPPWPYELASETSYDPEGRRVANPYPEMSLEEIASISPPLSNDAVLFLWTTHRFLPDSFELLKRWGLEYKATMVWDKEKIGMGAWLRMQCEFCLIAIKGSPFWDNTTYRDIIREPRREHSRKPQEFYNIVEAITAGRRLEYFSREAREGWQGYGNEPEKF